MNEIGKELAQEGLNILKGTKAFVIDQAPDFIQQVLAWQLASNAFTLVVVVVILLAAIYANKKWWDYTGKEGIEDARMFMLLNLFLLIPLGVAHCCALDLLKIHFAPKVFLLEYFAGLAK